MMHEQNTWIEIDNENDETLPVVGIEVLVRNEAADLAFAHLIGDVNGAWRRWMITSRVDNEWASITHWLYFAAPPLLKEDEKVEPTPKEEAA